MLWPLWLGPGSRLHGQPGEYSIYDSDLSPPWTTLRGWRHQGALPNLDDFSISCKRDTSCKSCRLKTCIFRLCYTQGICFVFTSLWTINEQPYWWKHVPEVGFAWHHNICMNHEKSPELSGEGLYDAKFPDVLFANLEQDNWIFLLFQHDCLAL